MNCKLKHWGDYEDGSDKKKEVQPDEIILTDDKTNLMLNIHNPGRRLKPIRLRNRNALVTQTVEVMHQTEMVQTLMDTYSDPLENYVMPNIDFPPENTADLLPDYRFAKPLWFIKPRDSNFSRGDRKPLPLITKPIVDVCMRKAVSGLLKMNDFIQSTDSALVTFVDALDNFYRGFMEAINEAVLFHEPAVPEERVATNPAAPNDKNRRLNVAVVEKGYHNMTGDSLTVLHNYYKHTIVQKNGQEIAEFQDMFGQYKRLQQQSQSLNQTADGVKDEDDNYLTGYGEYQAQVQYDGQQQMAQQQDDNMAGHYLVNAANQQPIHIQHHAPMIVNNVYAEVDGGTTVVAEEHSLQVHGGRHS